MKEIVSWHISFINSPLSSNAVIRAGNNLQILTDEGTRNIGGLIEAAGGNIRISGGLSNEDVVQIFKPDRRTTVTITTRGQVIAANGTVMLEDGDDVWIHVPSSSGQRQEITVKVKKSFWDAIGGLVLLFWHTQSK